MIITWLIAWLNRRLAAIVLARRRRWSRRCLAALSDRQLADAGIDLSQAARGRAVAGRRDYHLDGLH